MSVSLSGLDRSLQSQAALHATAEIWNRRQMPSAAFARHQRTRTLKRKELVVETSSVTLTSVVKRLRERRDLNLTIEVAAGPPST